MNDKKETVRFLVTCDYSTRTKLIRGVARRILNAGRNSPLAYSQPSLAALITDLVELKLNFPPKIQQQVDLSKKSMLMLFLHAPLHRALNAEAEKQGISATKVLINLIQNVDFKQVNVAFQDDLAIEQMIPCSYNLLAECRYKINREIARRMISQPTGLGKAEFENSGKVINEILAHHFQIALPAQTTNKTLADSDQVNFTIIMNADLNAALREYCTNQSNKGGFTSVNATIVNLINQTAEDEMW